MKKIFNNNQIKFIIDNHEKMTYSNMSELELFMGLSPKQIRNKARGLGLSKTRVFNKSYFSEINSYSKAYFLGLMYADGYVVSNPKTKNYESSIGLQYGDKYILDIMNREMGNVHIVKERRQNTTFNGYSYQSHSGVLRIYSKKITEDLIKHGVCPNKTEVVDFPKVEGDIFKHYLRGYFDGDGCLYLQDKKPPIVHFTCAIEENLVYIKDRIEKELNIIGKIYKEKDRKYRLMYFRSVETCILLDYMYADCGEFKLIRKFEKYQLAKASPYGN